MANKQTQMLMWVVAIAVVFGVGIFSLGQLGFITPQTALTLQGTSQQTALSTGEPPTCNNQQPVWQMVAYYVNTNVQNQYTQVATTYQLCLPGSPNCPVSSTTSATNVTLSPAGSLSCGQSYRQIAGDGGTTYYYASTKEPERIVVGSVPPANGGKGLEVLPSGAATMTAGSPSALPAATLLYNWTAGGGSNDSTDSNIFLRVQAPAKPAVFGDLGYAICTRYQSLNITSIVPSGSIGPAVGIRHITATATKDTVECYDMPAVPSGSFVEVPLVINAASLGPTGGGGNGGVAQYTNTTIDVILVDKTNQIYNGYLVPEDNAKAGVVSNGYDNVNTPTSDIGRTDVTSTTMITITR